MNLDFKLLFEAVQESILSLADIAPIKLILSGILLVTTGAQGAALSAFVALVFIDLLTKWIALTYLFLVNTGRDPQTISLPMCIYNIPAAFDAGYIASSVMKHRFCGKIIIYGLLTIMAANVDNMVSAAGESKMMLHMIWVYLAATEAMSILENLRNAGVEQAGDLLQFARDRMKFLFDRFKTK